MHDEVGGPPYCNQCEDAGQPLAYKPGDKVTKPKGYPYPGTVRAAFHNSAGEARYVVESDSPDTKGMLHIFNGDQLQHKQGDKRQ